MGDRAAKKASPGRGRTGIKILLCAVFSFLCSVLLVVGRTVYRTNSVHSLFDTGPHRAAACGAITVLWILCMAVSAAAYRGLGFLTGRCVRFARTSPAGPLYTADGRVKRWVFPVTWAAVFASWIPAFMAYYPGITAYDTYVQSRQAMGGLAAITRYHPPLHTMFWGLCIKAGAALGVDATLIYAPIQMAMLSFAFAVMLVFMLRRHCHPAVIVCSALYIVLDPVIAIFSVEMVKDSMLTVFLILLTVCLAALTDKLNETGGQSTAGIRFWLILGVLTAICCLLRNNIFYAVVLFLPFALMVCGRYRRQLAVTVGGALAVFLLINGPVYSALGIGEGNAREMLSVPIQQITTVAVQRGDDLSDKDREAIDAFLPYDELPDLYEPRFADYAKNAFDSEYFGEHKREFAQLWMDLFGRFPQEYWSAFLTLNIQLWYPGSAAVDPSSLADPDSDRRYIETFIFPSEYCSGERAGRFPRLLAYYEDVANFSDWMGWPVIRVLFALWAPIWILVICFFLLMARGRPEKTLILYIPAFLWLTYMAGPTSALRYVFPIMALYPLIIAVTLQAQEVSAG